MTTWYSIVITLPKPSKQIIFKGFFSVNNNLVTSFYDETQPSINIYTNNGKNNADSVFLTTPFYHFDNKGVNITSFPYLKKTQNDTSAWFNLFYGTKDFPNEFGIQSEKQSLIIGVDEYYFANMTFKTINEPNFRSNLEKKFSLVLTNSMDYSNPSYPSGKNHRSTFYKSLYDTSLLPFDKQYDNCNNTLCYTYSKNYIYKPHSDYGMVGRSSAGYLGQRNRL